MDTELLIIDDESEIIIEVDTDVEVLEAAAQGPRGPQGIPGPAGGATTVTVGAAPSAGTPPLLWILAGCWSMRTVPTKRISAQCRV